MKLNTDKLNAEEATPPARRVYGFGGRAGCVVTQKSRQTGTMVSIYRNDQAGLDASEPWSTVCEDHGTICAHDSLKLARWQLGDPAGWCEECQAKAKR